MRASAVSKARTPPAPLAKSLPRHLALVVLRERNYPAPPAPLDLDWMMVAACSEREVRNRQALVYGQSQSRVAEQAKVICVGWEVGA
jgi:hypothetical protein